MSELPDPRPAERRNPETPPMWYTNVPVEKRPEIARILADAAPAFRLLKEHLATQYSGLTRNRPDMALPSWPVQQAYQNGRAFELEQLYKLIP